jgi:hypothetical protein
MRMMIKLMLENNYDDDNDDCEDKYDECDDEDHNYYF